MKKGFLLLLVILGTVFFVVLPLQAGNNSACESFGVKRFSEKKEPLPFSLKDLNGNQVALSDYRGKPLLLFFWATWCRACKEDIVLLEKFYEGKKNQFEVLTLVIDGEKEKRVKRTVKRYKITLPVLLDVDEKIARSYGIRMIPTAFVINQDGWMEGMIIGQRDWRSQTALFAVQELLNLR